MNSQSKLNLVTEPGPDSKPKVPPIRQKFVGAALAQIGKPYIWGARGYQKWSPTGLADTGFAVECFDCSGLVVTALQRAGGPDWRLNHNAQSLYGECYTSGEVLPLPTSPLTEAELPFGCLFFYGASPAKISHVGIHIAHGLVLEASGGDSTTLTLTEAGRRNAKVRIGWNGRNDLIAVGTLAALK